MSDKEQLYDLLGVGAGPFNMSLAALLLPFKQVSSLFLDQKPSFVWHAGMLLPNSHLQVSFLKDLVTLIDPTNPYSFLNFLSKNKRLYSFVNADFSHIYREEFNQYLTWVSKSLPNLVFGEKVEEINHQHDHFIVTAANHQVIAKNIVLGQGITPNIPIWAKGKLSNNFFHNHDYMYHQHNWKDRRVVVVGGGQSSAEIVQMIIADKQNLPRELYWISRRKQFYPLDDSPFINEFFTPGYINRFYNLPPDVRGEKLDEQKLASDGISLPLLSDIYRRIYQLKVIDKCPIEIHLYPDHEVQTVADNQQTYEIQFKNLRFNMLRNLSVDSIVLCTGYITSIADCLAPLIGRIQCDDKGVMVNADYSLQWDGPATNRIYIQNAARHSHGIADPNLSLMAWRSAVIINSLLADNVYDVSGGDSLLDWHAIYPVIA